MSSHPLDILATRQRLNYLARYCSPVILTSALRIAGMIPSPSDWRRFIENMLLLWGLTLFLSGVIFFFAYNWATMHRLAKFATLEGGLLILLMIIVWRGLEVLAGKLTLLGASVFIGILLAVYGQVYQTGADVFTLFFTWALLIFPWVIMSRFAPLWFLFLLLINLTLILYWQQTIEILDSTPLFLFLYALNGLAFILWESAFRLGLPWLSSQWLGRMIFMAVVAVLLVPTLEAIIDLETLQMGFVDQHEKLLLSLAVIFYLVTTILALGYFLYLRQDLFFLTVNLGGVLITLTTFLEKVLPFEEPIAWFVLGMMVMGEVYLMTTFLFYLAKKWGGHYA